MRLVGIKGREGLNRALCEQDGWNYTHFVTPVSTLDRDRYLSHPTLPTSPLQMSPVIQSGARAQTRGVSRRFNGHRALEKLHD